MRIPDPVARGLVQAMAIERDKFRNEVNMLKAQTNLFIDRSPTLTMPAARRTQASHEGFRLTMAEREALENSISPEFLAAEGWHEGRSGELLNDAGRTFFQAGFTRAVRKALSASS
ncbi:MAG: hypothetical protein JSS56_25830 [Proteobacteria bacterium]|nr:hypothetical protein [Pseudomonadota bacterium]